MNLLLDTHVFLWFISGDARLSDHHRQLVQNANNAVHLSAVSVWEAIVKHQIGKLPLPEPPEIYLPREREQHRIESLALDEASVSQLPTLPKLHRDPFDRMLICQAKQHGLTIATDEPAIRAYPISVT